MDIGIFDNFEEDGQLTLFGIEEELEELQASARERAARAGKRAENARGAISGKQAEEELRKAAAGQQPAEEMQGAGLEGQSAQEKQDKQEKQMPEGKPAGQQSLGQEGDGIRIRSCSSCGKLLFVKEENGSCHSGCNACGIKYVQVLK